MNQFGAFAHKIFVGLSFSVLALGGFESVFTQMNETAIINKFIAKQAKDERAEEYPDARKVLRGDINGDKKTDLVILYTLEGFNGSNNYLQYLAVFLGTGKSFRYAAKEVVGGHAGRNIELKSIINRRINLNTMDPRRNDPACCPSKPGKTRYVFRNGKLREVK